MRYVADTVAVACDFAEAASRSINDWIRRCDATGFRPHSAARQILEVMQTMPAATQRFLIKRTRRAERSISRGLRHLVEAGLITEGYEPESGSRTFEVPEILTVVDDREDLLENCWGLNISDEPDVPTLLLEQIKASVAKHHKSSRTLSPRCGHQGVRSGKPCVRRKGHNGDHHYG